MLQLRANRRVHITLPNSYFSSSSCILRLNFYPTHKILDGYSLACALKGRLLHLPHPMSSRPQGDVSYAYVHSEQASMPYQS